MGSTTALERSAEGKPQETRIVDADVHPNLAPSDPYWREWFLDYLPQRWRDYVELRQPVPGPDAQLPPQRQNASRTDCDPPRGGSPGSDPQYAAAHLLDRYGIAAAVLNGQLVNRALGGPQPAELSRSVARAANEWLRNHWLEADPRWLATIAVQPEQPAAAAEEIHRCVETGARFVGVYLPSRTEQPIGNPRYWPILEAACDHGLPLVFHTSASMTSQLTASGVPNYYFDNHVLYGQQLYSIVASLIFEGAFQRFPALKVVLAELGWSTAIPFARRMDASWRVLRDEVPHIDRKPSEYFRDHFWFTTQPVDEPEHPQWLRSLVDQLVDFGFGDKLLYSSDYPHWDFDNPETVFPSAALSEELRAAIMGGNARDLYGHVMGGSVA